MSVSVSVICSTFVAKTKALISFEVTLHSSYASLVSHMQIVGLLVR